jgi:hypothetical protein
MSPPCHLRPTSTKATSKKELDGSGGLDGGGSGTAAPGGQKLPRSQGKHAGPKRPPYGAYVPGEQSTQNVPASPWRLPRGQAVHSAPPKERS